MDYEQAVERLRQSAKLGWKPGLESVGRLCARLGNPQDDVPSVHVAGTNGKGSICAMVASSLREAGYKTGVYMSPWLKDYRDSFDIGGEKVSREEFARVMTEVYVQADAMAAEGLYPTEFEILTAAAFLWFAQRGCDIMVIETGMGGRLDATNVISQPLVSVIAPISYDHMAYLGNTLAEIAREKCGIIKPGGVTVMSIEQGWEAETVIRETAAEKGNPLIVADTSKVTRRETSLFGTDMEYRGIGMHVRMGGGHQVANALAAVDTLLALRKRDFVIANEVISRGIGAAYLPARQEVLREAPFVMLDGGHNVQGLQSLALTMRDLWQRRPIVIMGMLADKQVEESVALMASVCWRFIAVRPDNPRALSPQALADIAWRRGVESKAYESMDEAVQDAAAFAGSEGAIVICGSLYLAEAARRAVDQHIPVAKQTDV